MTITLRAATPADATHMAALVNLAGGGLPASVWAAKANYGQDPLDYGRNEALREDDDAPMSYLRAEIAEIGGAVAGLLISYERPADPVVIDSGTHPLYRPLIRLENMAPRTRYINVLATFPHLQRRGVARALVTACEATPGPEGLSMIVTNSNVSALGFANSLGYAESARLPLIRANWQTDSTEWLLMRKSSAD